MGLLNDTHWDTGANNYRNYTKPIRRSPELTVGAFLFLSVEKHKKEFGYKSVIKLSQLDIKKDNKKAQKG